jgi:hypothetical protein
MTDKLPRYRKLVQTLAALGDEHAKAITSNRYRLMYHYFIRCVALASAIMTLVEVDNLTGAYALEKSLVDALLNGLYIGYVASDKENKEIKETIVLAMQGRCTGHSGMKKRAKMIDAIFSERRTFMTTPQFEDMVKRTSEFLNEFGHGGLLSTTLAVKNLPPPAANKVLSQAAFALIIFLGNVSIMENLDMTPMEAALKEFQQTSTELIPVTQYL